MSFGVLCLSAGFAWLFSLLYLTIEEKLIAKKIRGASQRQSPRYPWAIPLFGHVYSMVWDTPGFIGEVVNAFKGIPVRLNLVMTDVYIISGHDLIKQVLMAKDTHNHAYKSLSVQNMFKFPAEALKFWCSDDSGISAVPKQGSRVLPEHRIERMTFHTVHKLLTGPGLKPFCNRFVSNLMEQLSTENDIQDEWIYLDDLFPLIQEQLFTAALRALCGEDILKINPSFNQDYWEFHSHIHELAKGYPRWLRPKAYNARDRCIAAVQAWHQFIQPYLNDPSLAGQGWNPFYGADVIKARHDAWSRMDKMSYEATASEDLSLIWAANGNSVPAAFWMIVEILHDQHLFIKVMRRLKIYRRPQVSDSLAYDWESMCNDALLQAVYAEVMRTRVATFLMRSPDNDFFNVVGCHIPKDAVMMMSGYHAQMDKAVWERDGDPPTEMFGPERFLSSTYDARNDPFRHPDGDGEDGSVKENKHTDSVFSFGDRVHSWIPYGGGVRMCPGRHFNKQEMIVGMAAILTVFDIELVAPGGISLKSDMKGFGFGTLLPAAEIPVRIRRSKQLPEVLGAR